MMNDEVCWIENKDGDCFGVLRKNLVEVMAHCDDSGYYELCVDGDPVLSYPSLEEAKAAGNSILDAGPVPHEPRDMSDEAMKKAFNDHEHYGKQEFLIWEECWKYLRGNK